MEQNEEIEMNINLEENKKKFTIIFLVVFPAA
jgi:hypothetical protein